MFVERLPELLRTIAIVVSIIAKKVEEDSKGTIPSVASLRLDDDSGSGITLDEVLCPCTGSWWKGEFAKVARKNRPKRTCARAAEGTLSHHSIASDKLAEHLRLIVTTFIPLPEQKRNACQDLSHDIRILVGLRRKLTSSSQ